MSTETVRPADLQTLRAIASRLNGRAGLEPPEIERTAIRLGSYVAAGVIEIVVTNDVFGVAGSSAWAIIDFRDGHEQVCVPVSLQ